MKQTAKKAVCFFENGYRIIFLWSKMKILGRIKYRRYKMTVRDVFGHMY